MASQRSHGLKKRHFAVVKLLVQEKAEIPDKKSTVSLHRYTNS
jgi:hypothetical protein